MPNKKKMATLIIASLGKKPDYVQGPGEEADTGEYKVPGQDDDTEDKDLGLKSAMDDFLTAVERKDVEAMVKAFRAAVTLADCDDDDEGESEEG